MSTPCCQISTAYRLVVSEYEVPKVLVSQECGLFLRHPVVGFSPGLISEVLHLIDIF